MLHAAQGVEQGRGPFGAAQEDGGALLTQTRSELVPALDEEASQPFYRRAWEAGINFFDTADMYSAGVSEEVPRGERAAVQPSGAR